MLLVVLFDLCVGCFYILYVVQNHVFACFVTVLEKMWFLELANMQQTSSDSVYLKPHLAALTPDVFTLVFCAEINTFILN